MLPLQRLIFCFLCAPGQETLHATHTSTVRAFGLMPTSERRYHPSSIHHTHSSGHQRPSHGKYHQTFSSLRTGGDNVLSETGSDDVQRYTILSKSLRHRFLVNANAFIHKNFFLVGMFAAVVMAKLFPALGKNNGILRPELIIGNYGVAVIFLLSGLSLQTSELTEAMSNIKLIGLVQTCIFGVWPLCIGVPLHCVLTRWFPTFLPPALADGLLIMTTLPTTVNMCIMLTSASGGNVASSICNAVISNMVGIILTPLWLLKFFGASIQLPFAQMVLKLLQKVVLPVTVGQILRRTKAKDIYTQHSATFKRLQELVLLAIVWNAFCNAFTDGLGIGIKESLFLLGVLLPTLHLAILGAFFNFFSLPVFQFQRKDIIAAMFCASQKTLAFGLPLVNTIFQDHPNLAAVCAPIMFIHPLQMTIGSFLLPILQKYTATTSICSSGNDGGGR